MTKVAVYNRVSTEEQSNGWSLESQYEDNREYAQQQGYDVVRVLEDVHSGTDYDRPAFGRLLRLAKEGRVDRIVVWRMDRFGRDPAWNLLLERDLREEDITIETAKNGPLGNTPEARLYRVVQFGVDLYEAEKTTERCQKGRNTAAEDGKWPGGPTPHGYDLTDDSRLEPDPEIAPAIRELFDLVADGVSLTQAAEETDFDPRQVGRLLRNEAYRGALVYDEVVTEGAWPAIVEPEVWQEANEAVDERLEDLGREPADYVGWGERASATAEAS